MVMKISEAGIKLICKWEEFRGYAYVCPAGLMHRIGYFLAFFVTFTPKGNVKVT